VQRWQQIVVGVGIVYRHHVKTSHQASLLLLQERGRAGLLQARPQVQAAMPGSSVIRIRETFSDKLLISLRLTIR
jgi:hypothetical protein